MLRSAAFWKLAGVLVLVIVAINITLGLNLLPSFADAVKSERVAVLLITWGMVGVCAVCGVVLGLFLLTTKPAR